MTPATTLAPGSDVGGFTVTADQPGGGRVRVRCPACDTAFTVGASRAPVCPTCQRAPAAGWAGTDETVKVRYSPAPPTRGTARAQAKAGRVVSLEIARRKSVRITPAAARRVAAELLAAADAASADVPA